MWFYHVSFVVMTCIFFALLSFFFFLAFMFHLISFSDMAFVCFSSFIRIRCPHLHSFLSLFISLFLLLCFSFLICFFFVIFIIFPFYSPFFFFPLHLLSFLLLCSLSFPLSPSLSLVLSSGLWDTRDSNLQPGSLGIIPGQTLFRAMLGPPPNQRPGKGGVPSAAQSHALQHVSQAWWWHWIWGVEPPRSHQTRLPQAEFVCSWGLWGWPEQQVGEAEHLWFAGCDSPFRVGYRTLAGTGHKARRYCFWSQLVKYCRWSKRRNAFNISTVSLSAFLRLLSALSRVFLFLSFLLCFLSVYFWLSFSPSKKLFHLPITINTEYVQYID